QIYHYLNDGSSVSLFVTLPAIAGDIRQIFFDPGSSFGGNMLVTTNSGRIFEVSSAGVATQIANIGQDTEGLDIATSAWGTHVGDLLVASEGSSSLRLINHTTFAVTLVPGVSIPAAETVSFVP